MVGNDLFSDAIFKEYVQDYDGLIFDSETINGDLIYRCYYDYVEKCYCSCIECLGCLKDECRILFNSFNVIIEEYTKMTSYSCSHFDKLRDDILHLLQAGYYYEGGILDNTYILVEMELFTGDYIKKVVPASYIIKMLNYKGGEGND